MRFDFLRLFRRRSTTPQLATNMLVLFNGGSMKTTKIATVMLLAFLTTTMTGCAAAPQVSVEEACSSWDDAISNSDQLAGDMTIGETSADIRDRIEAWKEMVAAAKAISPTLTETDPLTSGLFEAFAETGDESIKVAERVADGAVDELQDADSARGVLLDAFYPIADVCIGDLFK